MMRLSTSAWLSPAAVPAQQQYRRRPYALRCQASSRAGESMGAELPQPPSDPHSRRAALASLVALPAAAAAAALLPCSPADALPPPAQAADALTTEQLFPGASTSAIYEEGQLRFTSTVYFDIGTCTSGARQDRRLGDKSVLCSDPEPLGRIIIGLYGTVAPQTVANFVRTVAEGSYTGTQFTKVLPGQYVVAGRQGSHRLGYVEPPPGLPSNSDLLSSSAFQLPHRKPGTVSLNLSVNEDDDAYRFDSSYRNTGFLITTGPGPVPSLDGENIVFGQVIEGLDVVSGIAAVPTFTPNDRLKAFNDFAKLLGDDRAGRARANWGRPITPVVITASGVLE